MAELTMLYKYLSFHFIDWVKTKNPVRVCSIFEGIFNVIPITHGSSVF